MSLQEGRVAGSLAVRLVIPQLGGAALVYAPEVDRAHVIAQVPERAASHCEDVRVSADGTVRVATRDATPRRAFAWARESLDLLEGSTLVTILVCGDRLDAADADLRVLRQFIARARELAARDSAGGEAPATSATTTARSATPPPTSADAATRAWLDASREAILGCAGRETVIVRVETASGATTVSLQPPLAGSPEEACVRSALGTPAAAPTGVVIHAVR